MKIDELLSSTGEEQFLKESDWLNDIGPEEVEEIYASFRPDFNSWQIALTEKLGAPAFTSHTDPGLARNLYPEAIELTGWKANNGFQLLALAHHDRETPVFISFGYRHAV